MNKVYPLHSTGLFDLRCDIKNLITNLNIHERILAELPPGDKFKAYHESTITDIENKYCELRQQLRNRGLIT